MNETHDHCEYQLELMCVVMNETCDQSALCISVGTDVCVHQWDKWPKCIVYISCNWCMGSWMKHVTTVHYEYQLELMCVFMNETCDQSVLHISVGTDVCVHERDMWPECIVYISWNWCVCVCSWMIHVNIVHCIYQLELMCVFMNDTCDRLHCVYQLELMYVSMNETPGQSALYISVVTDVCVHEWDMWPECIVYISCNWYESSWMGDMTRVHCVHQFKTDACIQNETRDQSHWMRDVTRVHCLNQLERVCVFMNETRDQSALWISIGTDVCVNKWDTWPESIEYIS